MSNEAHRWALDQKVGQFSHKLVLLALAYYADKETGECFPEKATLMKDTGLSKISVQTALKELREADLISDTGGRRGKTGQVIIYRLNICKGSSTNPLKGSTDSPLQEAKGSIQNIKGVNSAHQRGQSTASLYRGTVREPSGNRKNNNVVSANHSQHDAFEEFWEAYPHPPNRGSKKVAREKFSRVKDPPVVFHGVQNYAAYLASSDWQKPAMAQTWLHQERWTEWQEARFDDRKNCKVPGQTELPGYLAASLNRAGRGG